MHEITMCSVDFDDTVACLHSPLSGILEVGKNLFNRPDRKRNRREVAL